MRALVLIALLGCGHHEDRHDEATAPGQLTLDVTIDGAASKWTAATFAGVPRIAGVATDGEARDTWSLRELVQRQVGPTAHVVSVTGADGKRFIAPAEWSDAGKVPILHTTKRGTLKFRWADASGKWGDTVAKDVTALEIAR